LKRLKREGNFPAERLQKGGKKEAKGKEKEIKGRKRKEKISLDDGEIDQNGANPRTIALTR
jgi:hypothetical protein